VFQIMKMLKNEKERARFIRNERRIKYMYYLVCLIGVPIRIYASITYQDQYYVIWLDVL
jgi:hypothetical protein